MSGAHHHYTGEAGKQYHHIKRAVPMAAVPWIARLRAEKIQPFVRGTDTVFEYGAGTGWNLIGLQCKRRIAFDISEHAGSEDKTIQWITGLEEMSPASAEVVICHHALEHLLKPADALEAMKQWLHPGGRLLLYVPFEKERRYRHFNPAEPNHHLYSWNVQTLGNLVTECGFDVQSAGVGEFGYDRFAASLAIKLRMGETGFRIIRRVAHLLKPASEVRVVASRPS